MSRDHEAINVCDHGLAYATESPTATALLDQVTAGQARILAATASFDGRRRYCSFTVETSREPARPAHVGMDRAHPVVGVDAGCGTC